MKKGVTLTTLLLIIVSLLIGGIQVYGSENWQHGGITIDKPSPRLVGNNIVLTANVKGSKEGLQYKFVWETEGWKNWGIIRNFEDSNKVIWKPTEPGNYTIYSDIRDKYGNEKSEPLNIKVDSSGIMIDESSLFVDNDIVLTTKAEGSKEGLQYKFVWESEKWGKEVIRDFQSGNTATWKPTKSGDYTIYSYIKDKDGNIVTKTLNINVDNNFKHSGITTDKLSPGWVNSNITLTAKAEGLTKGLKYKFVWETEGWKNWGIIRNFEDSNKAIWEPTEPGDYTIYSDIKDKYGNTITEKINFNVRQHVGITANKSSPQLLGNDISLTANVKGPKEGLKYKFVWQMENWEKGNWGIIRDFQSENAATWKPTKPGNYTIYSDIKDNNNESVTENTSFKIFLSPQEINYSSDSIPAWKKFYLGVEGTTRLFTSNENVAKITPHNMVCGVSPGTAIIKAYNAYGKVLSERKVTVEQAQPIKFAYAYFNGSTRGSTFDLIAITDKNRDAVGFIAGDKFIEAKEKVEEGNTYVWTAKNVAAELENTEVKACSRSKNVWSTCSDGKISLYSLNNENDNVPSLKRRNISEAGIKFIAEWEGFKGSVYNDELAGNKPTVGYGKLINPGDIFYNDLTEREAWAMLIYKLDSGSYISAVNNFLITNSVKFNQNQFDSLVSFSYNLGTSWMGKDEKVKGYIFNAFENGTTQRNLSCIDPDGFSYEMLIYHHGIGHKCESGLLYRRIDEMNIFFKGVYIKHDYTYNPNGYRIPNCIKESGVEIRYNQ